MGNIIATAPDRTLHIYTRVSTAVQADEGMSLDFQAEIGVKRAKDLGFKHVLWNEGGKSSNHEGIDKRPVLSQVYSKILSGEIKHLFVFDQSRLSRNDDVSSAFRVACNRHGVTLYTKDGTYDLANSMDQFMKKIMDAVAEVVWNAVIEVMSKSVILKEQVKSKTFEEFGKARLDDSQLNAAKLKIKTLQKQVTKLNEALALVETNRILERVSAEQYPLIKANITDERTTFEAQIELLQDEIDGVARHKKWVDWVGTFQKQIADHKKFTPQQRRSFLEGMLAGVDVRLLDTKTHQLTINFQLPIVNDSMEYKSKGKKSGPYIVHEGTRSLTLEPLSRDWSKKKAT